MARKILFADDEEDIRYVTEILLRVAGYDVELQADAGFLDRLKPGRLPDLFLLDRHMNGMDMLEACRRLKSNEATRDIPVIMFSADPHIKKLYQEAGADDFVPKPFERFALLDAIERQFNKRKN